MKMFVMFFIKLCINNKTFRKFIQILNWEREKKEAQLLCKKISPFNKVLSGPFEGMIYPSLDSAGSALIPKILGSYEDELHELVYKIMQKRYNVIVDIGSAEGYYAVGLAMKIPQAKIYAYDIDSFAIQLCKSMAEKNKVADRFMFKKKCDVETLAEINFERKGLVVCDCEGFEKELFQERCVDNLKDCDVLIELHKRVHPGILSSITSKFNASHEATVISSKLKNIVDYPQLNFLNATEYNDALLIERNYTVEWLFLKPKVYQN